MPEPISFPTATSTFALPLLFSGQAQKEFFVNQSLVMIDSLMQPSVDGRFDAPPTDADDAKVYLVGNAATGAWQGQDDNIAVFVAGARQFVAPFDGMQIFDRAEGRFLIYRSGWIVPTAPADVQGCSMVDVEARFAIAEFSQILRDIGILGSEA